MRYIDKNTNRAAGNQVTQDYLDGHCKDAGGHYSGITYRNRRRTTYPEFCSCGSPTYYNRMVRLLLNEQNDRCCYCLRRLNFVTPDHDEAVTIEHIVPQSITIARQAEFDQYRTFAPNINTNVVLKDRFESTPGPQHTPPFPHTIAYDNMVASCNGSFPPGVGSKACCNGKRENYMALPVYFRSDIAQSLDYTSVH